MRQMHLVHSVARQAKGQEEVNAAISTNEGLIGGETRGPAELAAKGF